MRIDIISDTVCPWCFIGKRRLERALAARPDLPVEIGWRPFQLNPDMPREGMDRARYLKEKFGESSGGEVYRAIVEAGAGEGIAFDFKAIRRTPNSIASHRLIRHAAEAGRQDAVVEGLFRAYFEAGQDIGDIDTLTAVAASAGMDRDEVAAYLASDADEERVLAEDELARRLGINGVPCFIFERKYMISGAQSPEIFLQAFEMVAGEAPEGGEAAATT